jgi:hypothetical protein
MRHHPRRVSTPRRTRLGFPEDRSLDSCSLQSAEGHAVAHRLHHDLPAPLAQLHLPVTVVSAQPLTARA